jgi:hypothetical protein
LARRSGDVIGVPASRCSEEVGFKIVEACAAAIWEEEKNFLRSLLGKPSSKFMIGLAEDVRGTLSLKKYRLSYRHGTSWGHQTKILALHDIEGSKKGIDKVAQWEEALKTFASAPSPSGRVSKKRKAEEVVDMEIVGGIQKVAKTGTADGDTRTVVPFVTYVRWACA